MNCDVIYCNFVLLGGTRYLVPVPIKIGGAGSIIRVSLCGAQGASSKNTAQYLVVQLVWPDFIHNLCTWSKHHV